MIILAATIAAMQPSQAPVAEDGPLVRVNRSVAMPREIAPALLPYFQCVMNAFRDAGDETPIVSVETARAAQRQALGNCVATRNQVKAAAIEMLSRSSVERPDREAFVEQALVSIDRAQDPIVERFEGLERPPQD